MATYGGQAADGLRAVRIAKVCSREHPTIIAEFYGLNLHSCRIMFVFSGPASYILYPPLDDYIKRIQSYSIPTLFMLSIKNQ